MLADDHPLTIFQQSYSSCHIQHPDEFLISTQPRGPGEDGCLKVMHKSNFKFISVVWLDLLLQTTWTELPRLTKLAGWHFSSFLCLPLCSRLWRLQWFAKWWTRRREEKGLKHSKSWPSSWGNCNFPPPLPQSLNASEGLDNASYF